MENNKLNGRSGREQRSDTNTRGRLFLYASKIVPNEAADNVQPIIGCLTKSWQKLCMQHTEDCISLNEQPLHSTIVNVLFTLTVTHMHVHKHGRLPH